MSKATSCEKVREAVSCRLRSFGAHETSSMHETILIHNGLFCGRKFKCADYEVVWFIEEDEIKFFGPRGEMLGTSTSQACIAELENGKDLDDERRAA